MESSWTDRYVAEVDYTYGYYREIAPAMLSLAALHAGVATLPPRRYLELGFGNGLSLNLHAAASPGEFWGTDFNPSHVAEARDLAGPASNVRLLADSFAELLARPDLPEFDVIALHGVWSWITDENRRRIVDLVRRHLAIGGVLYVSYNALPGHAPIIPLQHLLQLHADLCGTDAEGLPARVRGAIAFASKLSGAGATYFQTSPRAAQLLARLPDQDVRYVGHEYFTGNWRAMAFSQVADALAEARLRFLTSAHLLDHIDSVNFTPEAQAVLEEVRHPVLRQTVRDYFVNQTFRRDLFARGSRLLDGAERLERLRARSFALWTRPEDVPREMSVPIGEATLKESVYGPLVATLAEADHAPKTLAFLADHPATRHIGITALIEGLMVLVGLGHVLPAQTPDEVADVASRCLAFNTRILERATRSAKIAVLASPVTGSGVPVDHVQQLFLRARREGEASPAGLVAYAWAALARQGKRVAKEKQALETEEENLAELAVLATAFEARLPVLHTLGLA
jgi:hypothetical protein